MVDKNEEAKSMKDARENLERPKDRPMTGILQKDDGRRTEHGLAPLDPSYNGTVIAQNKGVEEAAAARVDAGLEESGGEKPAEDVEAKKSAKA